MDDFFTSLKDNLENQPELPPREGAWRDMEERLNVASGKKRGTGIAWWVPLLLLLLSGSIASNYWFYRELRNHQPAPERAFNATYGSDTVYLTKVIYQTDTVYQTRIISESTRVEQPGMPLSTYLANTSVHRSTASLMEQRFQQPLQSWVSSANLWQAPPTNQSPSLWSSSTDANASAALAETNPEKSRWSLLDRLDHFLKQLPDYRRKEPAPELVMVNARKKKKTFGQQLIGMRPRSISLGANGGWVYPIHSSVNNQAGFAAGIQAALNFSEQFRLWGEAAYLQLHFQTSSLDDLAGIPPIPSPGDEYSFIFANVPQPALQYSFGLQYLFNPGKKWRPYLAAGISSGTLLPFEVTYEYEDVQNNVELTVKQKVDRQRLYSSQALFKSGLELDLRGNWALQFEALYRLNLENKGVTSSNMMGLRTGFLYNF
ncbi:MAG: hypothetical protein AAGG75_13845 [Bacteroidota bacterium]